MTLVCFLHAGIPSVTVGSTTALHYAMVPLSTACSLIFIRFKSLFGSFFRRLSWFVSTVVILCSVSVGRVEFSASMRPVRLSFRTL